MSKKLAYAWLRYMLLYAPKAGFYSVRLRSPHEDLWSHPWISGWGGSAWPRPTFGARLLRIFVSRL